MFDISKSSFPEESGKGDSCAVPVLSKNTLENVDNITEKQHEKNIEHENSHMVAKEESYTRNFIICGGGRFYAVDGDKAEYKPVIIEKITKFYEAKEPWPRDACLYQPFDVEQCILPDMANCLAVQAFLRMCNLQFQVVSRKNAEAMSPSGKVPFIKCGRYLIAELEPIVTFINNKGITLTQEMSDEQRSDMRAYLALIRSVLENAENYICWCDDKVYREVTKPRYCSEYPWPLNHYLAFLKRRSVIKRLRVYGWDTKTLNEVYDDVFKCCEALSKRLGTSEYFFGQKPTELDAVVACHLYALARVGAISSFNRIYHNLVNLSKKIALIYLEFSPDKIDNVFKAIDSVKFDEAVYFDNKEVGKLKTPSTSPLDPSSEETSEDIAENVDDKASAEEPMNN